MDWLNQNIGQPLSKGVGWLNQNIVQPVGGFAGKVADTLLGQDAGDSVRQLSSAVGKGADFLQKGLSKGEWDVNAGKAAFDEGMRAAKRIGGQVSGAFANPEGTIAGIANRLMKKAPQPVQQAYSQAASNPRIKAGMEKVKRAATGQLKNLSKRMRVA